MNTLYVFLIRNDVWIYIVCTFGLVWYVNQLLQARGILRRAMFGLEKEQGRAIRNSAIIFILVFSAVISAVYYVNAQIAPELPAEILRPPTSTPDIFSTRLSSPTPLGTPAGPLATATLPFVPTVTLPGQDNSIIVEENIEGTLVITTREPEGTSVPIITTPPTPTVACTPQLNISEPRDGAAASGLITFNGTADTDNFQFYTLEANGPETNGQWSSLLGRTVNEPVNEDFLGQANLQNWASGPYLVRLTAVDTNDNETGICVIQITLSGQ
jgi:hypothetical protein